MRAPEPPLAPLHGLPPIPPPPPAEHPHEGERARRRPSLVPEANASIPPLPHPDAPPATIPPMVPPPAEAPAPAAPVFKLKIGNKLPPPPIPPPAAESPAVDPLKAFEEASGGAPLLPLPGVGPAAGPGAILPPLAPLSSIPPIPTSPTIGEPVGMRGPIHLRAEAPAEALDPAKLPAPAAPMPARAAKAAVNRSHAKRDALLFGLIFLLVAGAGAGAYFYLSRPAPAPEPPRPAQNGGKTIAEAQPKEPTRVDAGKEGKATPSEPSAGKTGPGELQPKPQEKNNATPPVGPVATTTTPPRPEPTPTNVTPVPPAIPGPAPVPQASARFLRYADGIRVSGVFQGSPARALIDGRIVRQGEVVEPALGIKFADIDAEAKQIILEDASGARVKVKYL